MLLEEQIETEESNRALSDIFLIQWSEQIVEIRFSSSFFCRIN